ncbi:MAG: hypothetical protein AAGJ46_11540 [Planctomycetota bacterium]
MKSFDRVSKYAGYAASSVEAGNLFATCVRVVLSEPINFAMLTLASLLAWPAWLLIDRKLSTDLEEVRAERAALSDRDRWLTE